MLTLTLIVAASFIFLAAPYAALFYCMFRMLYTSTVSGHATDSVSLFERQLEHVTIHSADNVRMLNDDQIQELEN